MKYSTSRLLIIFFSLLVNQLFAQLPNSICPATGGTRADIIDVQTAYRAPSAAAPTFTIPAGATGALLTISSHANELVTPTGADQILGNEDFITITATLDLVANTSSGMLNFARNTNQNGSGTNLYSWLRTAFGTNVSTIIDKGQVTSPRLNGLTITRIGNQLTITETNNTIHSSYVIEFTSSSTNSFIENGVARVVFSGGTPNLKTVNVPANTNFVVISRKGTVRISNFNSTGGTEEGYSDERLLLDLDNNKMNGYSTVANGANAAFRSTYVIQNHVLTDNVNRFRNTGKVVGDFTSKSITNSSVVPLSDVGISDSRVYFTGTPAAGGVLTIDELPAYTNAFDGVYIFEFYRRTGVGMSVAFIDTRTAFIAKGQGSFTGTSRNISIPAGSDFIFFRQAGNANNTDNEPNENSLQTYAVINLNASPPSATGFYYQQVGFGSTTQRRDDNYGFVNLPLNGTSSRNATYSSGYYSTHANDRVYDLNFTLSADKSTLTIVNSYGLVATEYQTITEAQFFGRRPDLGFSTLGSDFFSANNGSCEDVEITVTVCNPGSGNSPGAFPVSFYDKDPTIDGTAKLIHLGNYANAVNQGFCNNYSFIVDLKNAGYNNPNIPVYCVINDNGSFAPGGVGTSIGTPFDLADLATQDPNSNYIECDYTNNMKVITIVDVMACPTVNPLTTTNQSPTLTGTWDNINAQTNGLAVTVNSVTYTLGSSPELTVVGNVWTLNLSAITLPIAIYPVTAVTTNAKGTATDGTTNELVITDLGIVHLDLNGLTDNIINGTPISAPEAQQLYINIIRTSTANVVAAIAVNPNGTYLLPALTPADYIFQLSTTQGLIGNPKVAATLPVGYVFTGEGVLAAGDGLPDGETTITYVNASTLVPNFGIQQRPLSGAPDLPGTVVGNVLQGTRFNPGTFGGFEIPSPAFGGSDDGQISGLRLTSLSTDILSLTHDGITYYREAADFPAGCPSATCQEFPGGGLVIPTNANGQPTNPLTLATDSDFLDGNLTVDYRVIDNANFESVAATTLTIPMVALKFQNGNWSNGSGTNNQPDNTDDEKTLFWVDNGGELNISATVKNFIVYSGTEATISSCLTVTDCVRVEGTVRLFAVNDGFAASPTYGQYLGPKLPNTTFEMIMSEPGWHNMGIPVSNADGSPITANDLATQNNTPADPFKVNLTNDIVTHNLWWYDTEWASGQEQGFFINRTNNSIEEGLNGNGYSSHAYGTWRMTQSTEELKLRGLNYFVDPYFTNTFPTKLVMTGTTNAEPVTYTTHDNWGGWNMIPNPYPVSLELLKMTGVDAPDFFGTEFDRAIWIWNPGDAFISPLPGSFNQGSYVAVDAQTGNPVTYPPNAGGNVLQTGAFIAPMQAFYIRRVTGSQTRRKTFGGGNPNVENFAPNDAVDPLDITANADDERLAGNNGDVTVTLHPEHRSACTITPHYKTNWDLIMLYAIDETNEALGDATELVFDYSFTEGFDVGYDIQKLGTPKGAPVLFSLVDGKSMVINKMNYPLDVTTVPMGFYAEENNKPYRIELAEMPEGWQVYLEDKYTGAWHDMRNGAYKFKNNTAFRIQRFVLHFSMKSDASLAGMISGSTAWGTTEGITVNFSRMQSETAEVMVTNLVGQVLYHNKAVKTNEDLYIPISKTDPQMYVVHVRTAEYIGANKVVR